MTPTVLNIRQSCQRGAVAVEAAIVLPLMTVFIGGPSMFLAFFFFQYTIVQKATHDAALYLATAPKLEMTTIGPGGEPIAMTLAKNIVNRETEGLTPNGATDPGIVCGYQVNATNISWKPCSATSSQTLAQVAVSVDISFINPITGNDTGWMMSGYAPVRYVGN